MKNSNLPKESKTKILFHSEAAGGEGVIRLDTFMRAWSDESIGGKILKLQCEELVVKS